MGATPGNELRSIPWSATRVRVTAGLMLAMLVAALDSTIVGTALPTIARELGDFALFAWVFSGYLLTATTTVPLWGRLADLFGRKRVLFSGLGIFIGASMDLDAPKISVLYELCGFIK